MKGEKINIFRFCEILIKYVLIQSSIALGTQVMNVGKHVQETIEEDQDDHNGKKQYKKNPE